MSNDSRALQIPTPGLEDSYSGDEEARQRSTTTEQEERSPQVEKKQLTPRQRNDSGSSLDGERQFHITDDLKEKILTQAEYYFSDENLKRDGFLLKHIKRNKEGYVNLKLLASFKKMRALSKDFKVLAEVLKESTNLMLNETGLKVKRLNPVPKELFDMVRIKFVVVSSIPSENPSMDFVSNAFKEYKDSIASVRIIKVGKQIPNDLQSHFSAHPDLTKENVAIVEFESPDVVANVLRIAFDEDPVYKGLAVAVLELGPKQRNKKLKQVESSGAEVVSSDDDVVIVKKKQHARITDLAASASSATASSEGSSSEGEPQPGFESFGSCSKRFVRRHGGDNSPTGSAGSSPQSSPTLKRHQKQKQRPGELEVNNNQRSPSPFRNSKSANNSPWDSPKDMKRKVSPLVRSASPKPRSKTTMDNNSPGASPLSSHAAREEAASHSDGGQSDWMRRRMLHAAAENGARTSCGPQFQIIRQPRGPSVGAGFQRPAVLEKHILVHAC